MKFASVIACSLLAVCSSPLYSQNDKDLDNYEPSSTLIDPGDEAGEQFDAEQWSSILPVNIHGKEAYWLVRQGMISLDQWSSLQNYIAENGNLLTINELQVIPNWDLMTIRKISPMISIRHSIHKPRPKPKHWFKYGEKLVSVYWRQYLQKQRGYQAINGEGPHYLGSPARTQVSFRWQYEDQFKAGIILEKDPGETMGKGSVADHIGYHVQVSNLLPFLRKLYIGDYRLSLGQGIIAFGGFSGGISGNMAQVISSARTLQVHRSAAETGYQRGIATEIELSDRILLQTWGFRQKVDARLDSIVGIRSLISHGLHRNNSELSVRKNVIKKGFGGRVAYRSGGLEFSLYNHSVYRTQSQYKPVENSQFAREISYGLDYNIRFRSLGLFGESVFQGEKKMAHIHGLYSGLSKKIQLGAVFRWYGPSYAAEFGRAISQQSNLSNEMGILWSIQIIPDHRWSVNFFVDNWRQISATIRDPWPKKGILYGATFNIRERYQWEGGLFIRIKQTQQSFSNEDEPLPPNGSANTSRFRLYYARHLDKGIEWRLRCELKMYTFENNKANGFFIASDFIYKPIGSALSFTCRMALFDCPEYVARIYAYENNLVYRGSSLAYSGTGKRLYLNMRFKPSKKLSLEARWAGTYYRDRSSVGSGHDMIEGNVRSELAFQIRWHL